MALALVAVAACTRSSKPGPSVTTSASGSATPSSSSAASSPTSSASGKVEFSDCSAQFRAAINNDRAKAMDFTCGKVIVPLDYAKPSGSKIDIFVVRVHWRKQQASARLGSLFVNPGGPGASGVNLAAGLVTQLSDDVFAHFDLIGFDPRGVGLSTPVECISDRQKDAYSAQNPDVRTVAGRAAARKVSSAIDRGCVAKYRSALDEYNTEETARDMDLIRAWTGDTKLNYLGYSYGTRLGATYAHLFPTRIRTAVLDGALDPVTPELVADERQAKGFEDAFDQFADDCRKRPACAVLGDPRTVVTNLIKSADRAPIRSSATGETRRASGGIVVIAVAAALYDRAQWNELGQALLAATRGDARAVFTLADGYLGRDPDTGHYNNLMDANLAVNCNDSTLKVTDALVAAKAVQWAAKYPIFGMNAAASLYNCISWPPSGHPLPSASAPGAPPILVVGTVHDPATPFSATGLLAKALGRGVVLSWNGEGHTAYPKTKCVTSKVNAYLITATVPAGNSCPAS
jgi:pimeloyl-ACP methyl ester carboxylesterase